MRLTFFRVVVFILFFASFAVAFYVWFSFNSSSDLGFRNASVAKFFRVNPSQAPSLNVVAKKPGVSITPDSLKPPVCEHTLGSSGLVADDQGYVCLWSSLDPSVSRRGCCSVQNPLPSLVPSNPTPSAPYSSAPPPSSSSPSASTSSLSFSSPSSSLTSLAPFERFSCIGCDSTRRCCEQQEFCVSCCMGPSPIGVGLPFQSCLSLCRTSSTSVVHNNKYRRNQRHCHGEGLPVELLQPTTTSLGESCDSACASLGLECEVDFFPLVNTCASLSAHLPCEEGCSSGSEPFFPALHPLQSDGSSVKGKGGCKTLSTPIWFSCDSSSPSARRLCPCRLPYTPTDNK
eukprot:GILI01027238.1.p1 GENE.GILI01027238.1~~GILI01027238.1.p1  ORF type:complete len:344 (+),score=38.12 GILI01027238.1:127-1158(+)